MDLQKMTALEMGGLIRSKKLSCIEALQESLRTIRQHESTLHAYITIFEEEATRRAADIQCRLDHGETLSPLAGVPMAVKDNISTQGFPTTCGSKMLQNYRPIFNATAIDRLYDAGAVMIGKLNMDEFAMGGSSETSWFGSVANPWNRRHVPGGSSGGSAAAVSAGEAVYALGSDTGGSIRQPCSFCNVTGIKPTYGSVSRYGLIAYASSLDQIGPMGRDVRDCAAILSIISGKDAKDSTSVLEQPYDFNDAFEGGELQGFTIGLPSNYLDEADSDVKEAILQAARVYEALGAHIEYFEMPLTDYALAAYYVIACAEAGSNLSRYDGIKYGFQAQAPSNSVEDTRSEGFGTEVKRRILLGSFVLSTGYYDAYYKKALQAREMIKKEYDRLFTRYDAILAPVAPGPAYPLEQNILDPVKMVLGDLFTVSVNLAGLPAVSLPCGFSTAESLPIGMQLIGKAFGEKTLIKAAWAYQQNTDFHTRRPFINHEGGVQHEI